MRWAGAATSGCRSGAEASDLREATIDLEVRTIDVTGLVRGKERHDIGDLEGQALASTSREAGNSDTGKLVAYQLDLARRQLLLERITRGESVHDLVPVQEIITTAPLEQALEQKEEEPLSHELPQRNFIPRGPQRSV